MNHKPFSESQPDTPTRKKRTVLRYFGAATAFLLVSSFLVYLGLTHTEVGRNSLRQELEFRFAETFNGRLTIGNISGNFRPVIRLQDVALYDEKDQLWLRAEEITTQASWWAMLSRKIDLRTLSIVGPSLNIEYRADSTWNLASVLKRDGSAAWTFESTQISLTDGSLTVSYEEHAPPAVESGWLFDLAAANVSNLSLQGEIRLDPGKRFLTIDSFGASIDTLQVEATGELVLEHGLLHVNMLQLSSSLNEVEVVGVYFGDERLMNLSLVQSFITPGFANAIVPKLMLPDSLSLSVDVERDDKRWNLQDLSAKTKRSQIVLNSSDIRSDKDLLSFNATIGPSVLDPMDAYALLGIDTWSERTMQLEGQLSGLKTIDDIQLEGTLEIATEASGRGQLEISASHDTTWSYTAQLTATAVDLHSHTGRQELSNTLLNGQLTVEGKGIRKPSLHTSLAIAPSTIANRSLDSLWIAGTVVDRQLNLNGFAVEQDARLETDLMATWADSVLSYETQGNLTAIDLGKLLPIPELETSINATWTFNGSGTDLATFSAALEIQTDSSTVNWNDLQRSAPPTKWSISVADPAVAGPRLIVGGDVLNLEASGTFHRILLEGIGNAWMGAFSEAFDRFAVKLRDNPPTTYANGPSLDQLNTAPQIEEALTSDQLTSLDLDVTWNLLAHPVTSALLPMLPELSSNIRGAVNIRADSDKLSLRSQIQDEVLVFGGVTTYQTKGTLTLEADLSQALESSWQIDLSLSADSLTNGGMAILQPDILIKQDGRTGIVNASAYSRDTNKPGHLSSNILLLPDRTRIQILKVVLPSEETTWETSQPASIDLFADAAVITPFRLENANPLLDEVQSVTVHGRLSSLPTDTLQLGLKAVDLNYLSNTFNLRRPLGGQINADLRWTGLWQPAITGTLKVDTLTFDKTLVGQVQASSTLLPGRTDLQVSMVVDSIRSAPAGYANASNQIALTGNMIIPGKESTGALDFSFDVQRLDASFLKLILRNFENFGGGFNGQVTLNGPPDNLVLGGTLTWEDGRFDIPKFNTSYEAAASVTLLDDKIHVEELLVQDGDGGSADLSGMLDLNGFRFLSFNAFIEVDALQILNVVNFTRDLAFYGDIRVSGDATLTGPVHTSFLRSDNLVITPQSEIYIPVRESDSVHDPGFIVYIDPTQPVEDQLASFRQRDNILAVRPKGEREFRDGLDMDLNITAPPGSTIRLVIDPLLGDVINGVGSARVQIQRTGGDVATYGSFELSSGDYLFTAGEVFVRRFLIDSGTITWNGEPLNPALDIEAAYRTRASRNGLPDDVGGSIKTSLPLFVNLNVAGTLNAVLIDLALEIDQRQEAISDTPLLDSYLNRPDLAAEHATSVLLTNSFLLSANGTRSGILTSSAVNSVSSLVANQLNRYLSQVIPQADFALGVQSDEAIQDLDVSAEIAVRLLNERLIIRGQGVYRGLNAEETTSRGLEGEFVVEIRLSPSVAVEVFYRREGDVLSETLITNETGLGLNYRTEFTSWRKLFGHQVSEPKELAEENH